MAIIPGNGGILANFVSQDQQPMKLETFLGQILFRKVSSDKAADKMPKIFVGSPYYMLCFSFIFSFVIKVSILVMPATAISELQVDFNRFTAGKFYLDRC